MPFGFQEKKTMGQTNRANSAFEIQAKENRQSKGILRNNVTNGGVCVSSDVRFSIYGGQSNLGILLA